MRSLAISLALLCLVSGCGGEDDKPESKTWQSVFSDLPGALISVSGTSARDIWAIGGDPGDGGGAFVLHFDGSRWQRLSTGHDVDLWWSHAFVDGPVFLGGSQGTILRYENATFERLPTPGTATVFGIWGASPDDLWAVGGDPQSPGQAFVWRFDGTSWAVAPIPDIPIASYFKVWGRSATEVRMVGADGVILHYDGSSIVQASSPTNRRLLTVHAEPDGNYTAVGGTSTAVIIEDDGGGWKDASPPAPSQPLFGVRRSGEDGYAVGSAGSVWRRQAGVWSTEELGMNVFADFHSVFIDEKRGVWAAGGDLLAIPLINGVLLHKGAQVPSGSYE